MMWPSPDVIGICYFLSEVALSVMKRSQSGAASKDQSFRLIWAVMPTTAVSCLLVAHLVPSATLPSASELYFIGLAVVLVGLVMRWGAVLQLGRFFTVDVNVAGDHRVIDSGFYRYVRHPSYSGVVIMFIGLGLCTANALSLAICALPPFLALRVRMNVEEKMLAEGLGEPYRDYMRRTKRLFPLIY